MATDSYWQLLRRPEWQRRRLEVMQAAEFRCESCDADDRTLNVHHKYYTKGAKPWEYPSEALTCLCEECHEGEHKARDAIKFAVGMMDTADMLRVLGYAQAMMLKSLAGPDTETTAFIAVGSYEEAWGIADAYGIVGNEGIDHITAAATAEGVNHRALTAIGKAQMRGPG